MKNKYKNNWEETRERYLKWWNREETDRPLLALSIPKKEYIDNSENNALNALWWPFPVFGNEAPEVMEQRYLDIEWTLDVAEKNFSSADYIGDAYPAMFAHLGPGSISAFLGSRPVFAPGNIWLEPGFKNIKEADLKLDHNSRWWKWSLESTKAAVKRASGQFYVGMPDLLENLDVLSALFGAQDFLYYLVDEPDEVHRLQKQLLPIFFEAFEAHHNIIKDETGWSDGSGVLGPGKVSRIQCDFSAMISPDMFQEFAIPYLTEESNWLDYSFYHLDGPGALCHLDSLLKVDSLDSVQWVSGSGQPDGGDPCWDFLYKKVLDAGKSVFAMMDPKYIKDFIKRFGSTGVMIMSSVNTYEEAIELLSLF